MKPEDIAVKLYKINYDSIGIKNPIENVHFYSKEKPTESFKMEKEEVSMLTPCRFEEFILRVFIKSPETKKKEEARAAFKTFCREKLGLDPAKLKDTLELTSFSEH